MLSKNENSAASQRQRILAYLRIHKNLDTLTARRELDALHPAGRVQELRKAGFPIATIWVDRQTECGRWHKVALYSLMPKCA